MNLFAHFFNKNLQKIHIFMYQGAPLWSPTPGPRAHPSWATAYWRRTSPGRCPAGTSDRATALRWGRPSSNLPPLKVFAFVSVYKVHEHPWYCLQRTVISACVRKRTFENTFFNS